MAGSVPPISAWNHALFLGGAPTESLKRHMSIAKRMEPVEPTSGVATAVPVRDAAARRTEVTSMPFDARRAPETVKRPPSMFSQPPSARSSTASRNSSDLPPASSCRK